MVRKLAECDISVSELDELIAQSHRNLQDTVAYDISIVTPMFGGSSTPGKVDAARPIRASSVRGHLRFWWRATRGAACLDTRELRQRESAIFGDTLTPGRIQIWIGSDETAVLEDVMKKPDARQMHNGRTKDVLDRTLPSYALFPFDEKQMKDNRSERTPFLPSHRFTLYIRFMDQPQLENHDNILSLDQLKFEIDAALCAWINFGGIGTRTRRGCGSLFSPSFSPSSKIAKEVDFRRWFVQDFIGKYQIRLLPNGSSREWPTLSSEFAVGSAQSNIRRAWREVIEAYKRFRRRANKYGKGRSEWPEADSIRGMTGMAEPNHRERYPKDKPEVLRAFPRAQLGLPIIVQFKEGSKMPKFRDDNREPYKTQLVPADKERLASPLILKAIVSKTSGGFSSVGAIVILNQPKITGLELKLIPEYGEDHNKDPQSHYNRVQKRLRDYPIEERHIYPLLGYSNHPMKRNNNMQATTLAVSAFLHSKEVSDWKAGSQR